MAARWPFWKWRHWKSIDFCLWPPSLCIWNLKLKANLTYAPETMPPTESRNRKIQYGSQAAILKMTTQKIIRLRPICISIALLKFVVDIQSQSKVRVWKPKNPFCKWRRWKSISSCLWPLSTCIWNLKLKFQSKLDLCSGNHGVYRPTDRRTDGRTDKVNPVTPPPPPPNFVGRGYNNIYAITFHHQFVRGLAD